MLPAAIAAAVLLVLPLFTSGYLLRFLTKLCMWAALASSWNMITGYTKRTDFGHVVFFGTGAYISMILILTEGVPWVFAMIGGAIVAAVLALLVGLPTLKLTGAYFAIATWSVAEAFKWVYYVLPRNISGGPNGLNIPLMVSNELLYVMAFAVMAATVFLNYLIERSELGYSLRAISENETAAEAMGISVSRPKLTAYVLSAIPAALIGFIYAIWVGYLHPLDAFDSVKTDTMLVMVLLGGMGNWLGAVVGAIFFSLVFELLWTYFTNTLYQIFLAILIILTILFLPKGILGTKRITNFFKEIAKRYKTWK
jgi:branched-chain amino acid transport system permease protein